MGVSFGSGFGNAALQNFAAQKRAVASQADAGLVQAEQALRDATQKKKPHFGQIQMLAQDVALKKTIATHSNKEANTAKQNTKINYLA